MRLFVALPLPDGARRELGQMLDRLRSRDWPVRWVRDDGLHLTLKFFGEVDPGQVGVISRALETATQGTPPLPLALTALGAFPTPQRARVLWIGVEAPAALELLADRVERACLDIGFPVEGKPFHPHITLGRVREGGRLAAGALRDGGLPPLGTAFQAEEVVLFESRTGREGATHTRLFTCTLQ